MSGIEQKALMDDVQKEYDWYFGRSFVRQVTDYLCGKNPPAQTKLSNVLITEADFKEYILMDVDSYNFAREVDYMLRNSQSRVERYCDFIDTLSLKYPRSAKSIHLILIAILSVFVASLLNLLACFWHTFQT